MIKDAVWNKMRGSSLRWNDKRCLGGGEIPASAGIAMQNRIIDSVTFYSFFSLCISGIAILGNDGIFCLQA